jgi:uncharacterized protein (TIGR03083 family)
MPTIVEIAPMRDLLRADWAALDQLCAPLSDEQWATPTCLPGWTVQDVLAHVIGTELMLEGVPAPQVDVSHLTHLRNDIARMGEVWVEDLRPLSGTQVLERFREVTARRGTALDAMDQADFDAPSWTPVSKDETYGRFMRIRHYDTYLHEHDIRLALGAPDRLDVAAIEAALPEVDGALGYIVGRKAALPDGSVVRIDLTGPVVRTYVVVVDGRAQVVEDPELEPEVTLAMSDLAFLRLTGSRTGPSDHLGVDLEISGDQAKGLHLASNMAMTI